MTHGVAADVDEHLHVGAVRLAEEHRPAAGDGFDRLREPDRQRMVGRDPGRPEAAAGDLDRGRVVAQERVRGTGGRDAARSSASASAGDWPSRTP